MVVHGAAHVHEQQHFDVIVPFRNHLDVQVACIGRCAADGVVQVEFEIVAFAGELAQAAQCDLDVARAQFLGVVIVFVGALVPHLDGTAVAAFVLANAYALRVVAVGAERRSTARTDPFAAAFVALFLFFKALF